MVWCVERVKAMAVLNCIFHYLTLSWPSLAQYSTPSQLPPLPDLIPSLDTLTNEAKGGPEEGGTCRCYRNCNIEGDPVGPVLHFIVSPANAP
jgi:hypothetical protein